MVAGGHPFKKKQQFSYLMYRKLVSEPNGFVYSCPFYLKQEEIDEDDERLLEAFLSKDAGPQVTLADLIIKKIKENDANIALGGCCHHDHQMVMSVSFLILLILIFFKFLFVLELCRNTAFAQVG